MFIASAPGVVSKKVLRPKIKPPNQVWLVIIPDTHDTFFSFSILFPISFSILFPINFDRWKKTRMELKRILTRDLIMYQRNRMSPSFLLNSKQAMKACQHWVYNLEQSLSTFWASSPGWRQILTSLSWSQFFAKFAHVVFVFNHVFAT